MPAPRIKLSPIKRSLPEPILPVLNSPAPAAAPVTTTPAWQGVPVPSKKKASPAPLDPPAPVEAQVSVQAPGVGATAESSLAAPEAVAGPAVEEPTVPDGVLAAPVETAALALEGTAVAAVPVVAGAAVPAAPVSHTAAALSISRANGIGTLVPVGSPSAGTPAGGIVPLVAVAGGAASASGGAAPVGTVDGSGALLAASNQPGKIRATAVFIKWGAFVVATLVVAFVLVRFLVPFVTELKNPTPKGTPIDKDAPTAVKMIQQTRAIVEKGNANAAYLNEIAAAAETKPVVVPAAVPAPAPVAPPKPVVAQPTDNTRFTLAIDRLKVDSVVSGDAPRAMIDGRLIRKGDIVNRTLGLRFAGVDVESHTVLFTNADNVVFKKYY